MKSTKGMLIMYMQQYRGLTFSFLQFYTFNYLSSANCVNDVSHVRLYTI